MTGLGGSRVSSCRSPLTRRWACASHQTGATSPPHCWRLTSTPYAAVRQVGRAARARSCQLYPLRARCSPCLCRAHMHFVTVPDIAMGETSLEACGLIVWTEGGRVMRQVMLPSGAPSRAAAAEGARVTAPPTLNWLLPNVMASCAISSDSVTLPAACTPHDSQISHPALALLVGRSGDRPSRRRSGGMGHKRTR